MSQTSFCVAGMHCSGTSMFPEVLFECGICMGNPARFLPPAHNNKRGHFEDEAFMHLNNGVLARLGGYWDNPPSEPAVWDRAFPGEGAIRATAATLLWEFKDAAIFGWKDPRNCITLPFWKLVIPGIRVVVVVRHPGEACKSLMGRGERFDQEKCFRLWTQYNERLLRAVPKKDRLICDMDAMHMAREREVARIMNFIGGRPSPEQLQKSYEAVDESQRNHDAKRDVVPSMGVREREIYDAMLAESLS